MRQSSEHLPVKRRSSPHCRGRHPICLAGNIFRSEASACSKIVREFLNSPCVLLPSSIFWIATLGGKKLLVLRGQSDAEEGILAAQAGEDSGICWDEAEEGYG
jgi:hypothetical protein